jgi:hypothetical protein
LAPWALAESGVDGCFLPPDPAKSLSDDEVSALPPALVAQYLSEVAVVHTFRVFEGQNDSLAKAAPDSPLLSVASNYPIDMAAAELFGSPLADEAGQVYLASIRSIDAHALRLLVDLSGLREDEEVWVLDPTAPRAFGPYGCADAVEGGRWLATVIGDTATLMARTPSGASPQVALQGVSHFYRDFTEEKELACNINIACDTNSMVQQASTGVALLIVSTGSQTLVATGELINVPTTPQFEPYLLTGHHVIGDPTQAQNLDVIWDFRSTLCIGNDAPPPSRLPHSKGVAMLATSATLDATLIELDKVAVGRHGRAYLGWDTREPAVNEKVVVIHHPNAKHMRISYGRVRAIDQPASTYLGETLVGWDDGVTEPGSSGAPLLLADRLYRIAGTLTGGSNQSCTGTAETNWDYFSSFPRFFKDISPAYLTLESANTMSPRPIAGEGEGEGEGETDNGCLAAPTAPISPKGSGGDAIALCAAATMLALASIRFRRQPKRA